MEKVVLLGGSTRSEIAPAFDLIPPEGIRRIAQRFNKGALKHGENNWKLSLQNETNARAFCFEAFNHMMEHSLKMVNGEDPEDDHLGAIGWAVTVLAYAEKKYGKSWRLLDIDSDTIE